MVFERLDGTRFSSAAELEDTLAVGRTAPPSVSESLHELLTLVMERPPTLGVVEAWTLGEKREVLQWATAVAMVEEFLNGKTEPEALPPAPDFVRAAAGGGTA